MPPSPPAAPPSRRWWVLGACLTATVATGVYLALMPNGGAVGNQVDNITEAVAAAAAGVASLASARRPGGARRRAWLAMAGGTLAWAAGEAVLTGYEWGGADAPFPGVPDVGFLLFPVGCLVAVTLLSRSVVAETAVHRRVLDGVIVGAGLLVAAGTTSISQALLDHQGSGFAAAVAVAYPITDVVLCATTVNLLARARHLRPVLVLLAAGLAALSVSDTAYTYLANVADFSSWQWLDTFWTGGFLLIATAAAFDAAPSERTDGPGATRAPLISSWQIALPYAPTGLAFLAVLIRLVVRHRLGPAELGGGAALFVLLLARQLVALAEVRRLAGQVQHQAFHDPLTGLANRALFLDRLEHAVGAYHQELRPCAVVFIDLDGFKAINDSYGHAVGDQVLGEVAARLRACISSADTVGRLGGDEFAVLLEGSSVDALDVATRVRAALRPPLRIDGGLVLRFRASLGIARIDATVDDAGAELLRRADVALYAAKAAGKDTIRDHHQLPPPDAPGGRVAAGLAAALGTGALTVAYQPGPLTPNVLVPLASVFHVGGRSGRSS